MNKHEAKGWARQLLANRRIVRFSVVARVLVFVAAVTIAGLGYSQYAEAAQTVSAYCGQYSGDAQTACKDGVRGADCSDYGTIFSGQSDVNSIIEACKSGTLAQQGGQISGSPSSSNSSSSTKDQAAYKNAVILACSQYDDRQQKLSCLYGGLGENGDATSPVSIADCTNSSIIKNSGNVAQNRAACNTGSTSGQTYLSLQNNKDSTSSNPNSILDQLDQASSLSQYVDVLHASGPNAGTDLSDKADNEFASYIDGAGNKQSIKVNPCTTAGEGGNCPAIIWLNGGGWHANDGTAYCLATGSSQKNCQGGGDGGGDTGAGDKGAPAGGGANQRGFTVIEVSYRLGSSGVYYMFEDVMRGIQHVINNASMYHIDQSKIAVGGDSSGGSLAMRAITSGKSGAKVGIGWSPPTNAYTGLFRSYKSLMIGMDHSTCIPTDLAGLTNTTDLLTGGSGDVAEYGQGLSSNDFSGLTGLLGGSSSGGGSSDGLSGGIGMITQALSAAQYAADTGKNVEAISKQLESAYNNGDPSIDSITNSGLPSGVFNLSAKKLIECIDNFNVLSPALFASPDSPPAFVAGFDSDDVVGPEQVYGMRDKLQSLGIESKALVIPGDADAGNQALGASDNHLGYDPRFVCDTLNFVDHIFDPGKDADQVDCATGKKPSEVASEQAAASGGGGDTAATGDGKGGDTSSSKAGDSCKTSDGKSGTLKDPAGAHGTLFCSIPDSQQASTPATKKTCPGADWELHDDGKCWHIRYTMVKGAPSKSWCMSSGGDHFDNTGPGVAGTCYTRNGYSESRDPS